MDNKHNSLNLAAKICSDICPWTYLFLEAHRFPRASLSENCSLLGTDNVCGQISEHIFAPNEGYCLYTDRLWEIFNETRCHVDPHSGFQMANECLGSQEYQTIVLQNGLCVAHYCSKNPKGLSAFQRLEL